MKTYLTVVSACSVYQAVPVQAFESEDVFRGAGRMQEEIAEHLAGLQTQMKERDAVDKQLQKSKRREKLAALKAKRKQENAVSTRGPLESASIGCLTPCLSL